MYLSPSKFGETYPEGELINQSGHSWVYFGPDQTVIKVINENNIVEPMFYSFLNEINIYSQVEHPCISRLIAWTIDGATAKLVLPHLSSPPDDLSFDKVLGEILSAMSALYTIRRCHNDLKYSNILYNSETGYLQLIDFGITSRIQSYSNGTFILFPIQTSSHRDPEISFDEDKFSGDPVDIRAELYSAAMTVCGIVATSWYPFSNPLELDEDYQQEILSGMTRFPLTERWTVSEIFSRYPQLEYLPCKSREVVYPPLTLDRPNIVRSFIYLLEMLAPRKSSLSTLFLTLSLFRRSYPVICPDNSLDFEIFLKACVFIIQQLEHDRRSYKVSKLIESVAAIQYETFIECVVKIVISVDGQISSLTPWDSAQSYSDIYPAFVDMTSKEWDIRYLRPNFDPVGQKSKDVTCDIFYSDLLTTYGKNHLGLAILEDKGRFYTNVPFLIRPCHTELPLVKFGSTYEKLIDFIEGRLSDLSHNHRYQICHWIVKVYPGLSSEDQQKFRNYSIGKHRIFRTILNQLDPL